MSERYVNVDDVQKLLNHALPSAFVRHGDTWTVSPSSVDDVAKVVGLADQCGCPVRVAAPREEPETDEASSAVIRISMEKMTDVKWVNEESMTAKVQAGLSVRHLEILLNDHGMTSGFVVLPEYDPTLIEFVTDENLSESSVLYGRPDRAFLGVEGVLPSGEAFSTKPTPSRAVGPDLLGMLVSQHGSLSIITSLVLRIWRQPKSRRIVCASFDDVERAVGCASRVAHSGVRLAAGRIYAPEWLEDSGEEGGRGENIAVFVLEGEQAVIDSFADVIEKIIHEAGGGDLNKHPLATKFVRSHGLCTERKQNLSSLSMIRRENITDTAKFQLSAKASFIREIFTNEYAGDMGMW
ncbi:MAG: FAD-binding protein, partial [Pseudomonadota bacterium]